MERREAGAVLRKRALAVRGGALGDFILTWPSLRALREAGYEVELLTRPAYGRLAEAAGWVSGWRALEAPEAGFLTIPGAVPNEDWREWLSGFEVVVSWVPDADGAMRSQMMAGGVSRFYQGDGHCKGRGPAAFQLGKAVSFTGSRICAVEDVRVEEAPSEKRLGPLMALHPGSGSVRKNWPFERWIEVMGSLSGKVPNGSWLVITGEAEEVRWPSMAGALDQAGLRWESARALDLGSLCRRLRECRVLLGHDSGISHLAAACGVPCRLLFGPTDPAVWAPLGKNVRVLPAPGGDLLALSPQQVLGWLETLG